jgi:hypothetical protein
MNPAPILNKIPRVRRWLAASLCLAVATFSESHPEQSANAPTSPGAFKELSLEELMNLDVASVAREPEPYGHPSVDLQKGADMNPARILI